MRLPQFFIDRPIFATVVSVVIVLLGSLAYVNLPITQYPEVVPPTIQVVATYPGASPEVLAETVATPLEQAINGVEDMLYMTSSSTSDGTMTLTVTFRLGTDIDQAQVQVQNRVATAEPRLPETVRRTGVVTQKRSPDLMLVAHLLSPSGRFDKLFLGNYAFLHIRDQLARIDGVGDVRVFGADEYSMRIWLDPQRLASLDLTAGDVVSALQEQNVQVAAGVIGQQPMAEPHAFQMNVRARGRLKSPAEFGEVVVKSDDEGRLVRLADVARIELGAQSYSLRGFLDGEPAVGIGVFQRPGSNALLTSRLVHEKLDELAKDFPAGMEHSIVYDPTVFVRKSMDSVQETLLEALFFVVLVVLVFLQNWRAAIIPLAAIPVSLIGTFAVMSAVGFTLNNLTLFGLVLAIGIVVDDAIVVVENVERHLGEGLSPRDATRTAMEEVGNALVAMALVLVAVFVPTAFLTGISGAFYRQFAITIATATVISALVSLTLSPAMARLFLRAEGTPPDPFQRLWDVLFGWFFRIFDRVFELAAGGYQRVVRRAVRTAAVLLVAYLGLVGLTGFEFSRVPGGFIPPQDAGYLIVAVQLPDAASLDRTEEVVHRVSALARSVEGVAHTVEFVGFSGATFSQASNAAAIFLPLAPFDERIKTGRSSDVIFADVQRKLSTVVDGLAVVIPPPPVHGIGTGGGFKMMLEDRHGGTPAELQQAAYQLVGAAAKEPSIVQPFTLYRGMTPQFEAEIDRTRAKMLDVPLENVFQALQVYFGSTFVNEFNEFDRTYRVVAQAEPRFRDDVDDVRFLETRNTRGETVPLGSLLEMKRVTGPDRVVRHNLYPAAEIGGATAPGYSTGQALATMERLARELPPGYDYEWVDLAFQERATGNTAWVNFVLAVVFVFLLLAAQYESWTLPLAILLIVPMCLLGAGAGLLLRGMSNDVLTQIGFVVLIGLAAKNAILIVEFAKQLEDRGLERHAAAIEAARLRLRPILMTAFTFILGVIPLLLARGAGAEMRRSIGTAVFAGMLGVTLLGLLYTPLFYVVVRGVFSRLWRGGEPVPPPAEASREA